MKKIVLLFILALLRFHGIAQIEQTPLSIGLGAGIDFISNTDQSASPLNYHGYGLPLGLKVFKVSNKWLHQFEAQAIASLLTNNYSLSSNVNTELVDWVKVNLSYQLLRKMDDRSRHFLGGELRSKLFHREYNFLDGYGWEFQNSLNAHYAQKIDINQRSFLLPQISIPLVGYIHRKPSLTYDEEFLDDFNNEGALRLVEYGQFKTIFDDWLAVDLNVLYHLRLSERWNVQAQVGFHFYQISFPETVHHINVPVQCYLNYQF